MYISVKDSLQTYSSYHCIVRGLIPLAHVGIRTGDLLFLDALVHIGCSYVGCYVSNFALKIFTEM